MVKNYVDEDSSHLARAGILGFVFITQILCGGTIFGFTPLKQIYITEGVYEELCVLEEDIPCAPQLARLDSMFTLAASLFSACLMPAGLCLRFFGPRFNYLLGLSLNSAGSILLHFANSRTFDVYILGYVLLATGNPLLYMAAFNYGKLYPRSSDLLLSIFIGCFGFSSVVFYIFQEINYSFELTSSELFLGYAFFPIALGLIGVWILAPYPYVVQREKKFAMVDASLVVDEATPLNPKDKDVEHADNNNDKPIPLKDRSTPQQLLSMPFFAQTIFFCWGMLHQNFYLGTMPDQVYMLDNDGGKTAARIVEKFSFMYPVGSLMAILPVGMIVRNTSVSTSIFVFCAANLLFSSLSLCPDVDVQWATTGIYILVRVGFFTVMSTFSSHIFGFQNLSTMFGAAGCLAGLCSLSGYFLTYRALDVDDSFTFVNSILLVGGVLNFIFPSLTRIFWETQQL